MVIAVLALIGVLDAAYLSLYKLGIIGGLTCTIGSCEQVQNSPQSALFGIPVSVDALTRFEDSSDADIRDFDLDDVAVGDFLEVRGVEDPDNAVLAAELRRDDADDEVTVQGTVDEVTAGEALTLLGITVVVDGGTEYRDAADNPMGASDFFAAVSTGTSVKAKGVDLGAGVLGAEELELEPED